MNRTLLENEMRKKGKSILDMCVMLDISRSAFYRKRKGISQFTQKEIQKIVDFLELDSPMAIFFAH